jgi:hypothetical protein
MRVDQTPTACLAAARTHAEIAQACAARGDNRDAWHQAIVARQMLDQAIAQLTPATCRCSGAVEALVKETAR